MNAVIAMLHELAQVLPLEFFVMLGSFIEEAIPPIPSPSILIIAGSFAIVQGYTHEQLAILVILAAIGKTLGGLTMYTLANVARGPLFRFMSRFADLSESRIETFRSRLTGGPRDYLIFTFFRALPIIPSVILSFGAGVIRLPLRLFIIGTFIGTLVRDTFYIIVGYTGGALLGRALSHTDRLESVALYLTLFILGGYVILHLRKRRVENRD